MRRAKGLLVALTLVGASLVTAPAHAAVTVTIKDPNACFSEGDALEKKLVFRVVLSEAATETVTVDYATVEDVAKSGQDFVQINGTLTFNEGQRVKRVKVPIVDDLRNERDFERLFVRLSNAQGASIADPSAAGLICNDDPFPTIDVGDVFVAETGVAELPVRLTQRSGRKVTLYYEVGVEGSPDYTATTGTLVWPPGTKTRRIMVPISDDWLDEPTQRVRVELYGGTNVGSPTENTWHFDMKILDDDPLPTVSVDDVSINESDAILGSPIPIPLAWMGETEKQDVSVKFRLVPLYGPGDPQQDWDATEGIDYETPSDGLLLFGMSAFVTLIHDSDPEFNESFKIELYDARKVEIADGEAIVTIMDDDVSSSGTPRRGPGNDF